MSDKKNSNDPLKTLTDYLKDGIKEYFNELLKTESEKFTELFKKEMAKHVDTIILEVLDVYETTFNKNTLQITVKVDKSKLFNKTKED